MAYTNLNAVVGVCVFFRSPKRHAVINLRSALGLSSSSSEPNDAYKSLCCNPTSTKICDRPSREQYNSAERMNGVCQLIWRDIAHLPPPTRSLDACQVSSILHIIRRVTTLYNYFITSRSTASGAVCRASVALVLIRVFLN